MDLLSILIKEREIEWERSVAQCAERFTALGALLSSGFQLDLVDLVVQELKARCRLYVKCQGNEIDFDEFFKTQKTNLLSGLKSHFGESIPGEERYSLLEESYRTVMSLNRPPAPKPPIGFNIE
jgi:hypothetical protein